MLTCFVNHVNDLNIRTKARKKNKIKKRKTQNHNSHLPLKSLVTVVAE